jgi:hypothetical protein
MKTYPKSIKKQLRELSGKAYQRELDAALSDLEKQFNLWRQGEMDCWELEDLIHKFHNGIARELYKQYAYGNAYDWHVVQALRNNILQRQDIPDEVYEHIGCLTEIGN